MTTVYHPTSVDSRRPVVCRKIQAVLELANGHPMDPSYVALLQQVVPVLLQGIRSEPENLMNLWKTAAFDYFNLGTLILDPGDAAPAVEFGLSDGRGVSDEQVPSLSILIGGRGVLPGYPVSQRLEPETGNGCHPSGAHDVLLKSPRIKRTKHHTTMENATPPPPVEESSSPPDASYMSTPASADEEKTLLEVHEEHDYLLIGTRLPLAEPVDDDDCPPTLWSDLVAMFSDVGLWCYSQVLLCHCQWIHLQSQVLRKTTTAVKRCSNWFWGRVDPLDLGMELPGDWRERVAGGGKAAAGGEVTAPTGEQPEGKHPGGLRGSGAPVCRR